MGKINLFIVDGVVIDTAKSVGRQKNENPINEDTGVRYAFPIEIVEINDKNLPKDFENTKYCYSQKDGFTENPYYSEPTQTAEEIVDSALPVIQDRLAELDGAVIELVELIHEVLEG